MKIASSNSYGDGNDHHKNENTQRLRETETENKIFNRIYGCAGRKCAQQHQQQPQIIEQTATNEIKVNKFWIKSQLMSLINGPTNCPFCIAHFFFCLP